MKNKMIYWLPRVLACFLTVFISLMHLEVFGSGYELAQITTAFLIQMTPVFILILITAISWKHPAIGGLVFIGLAFAYVIKVPEQQLVNYLIVPGALFLIGLLFALNKKK